MADGCEARWPLGAHSATAWGQPAAARRAHVGGGLIFTQRFIGAKRKLLLEPTARLSSTRYRRCWLRVWQPQQRPHNLAKPKLAKSMGRFLPAGIIARAAAGAWRWHGSNVYDCPHVSTASIFLCNNFRGAAWPSKVRTLAPHSNSSNQGSHTWPTISNGVGGANSAN